MTGLKRSFRPLSEIVEDILTDTRTRIPTDVKDSIVAVAGIRAVEDDTSYRIVAAARTSMNRLRSPMARQVKLELEIILAHYRADHWPG